MIKAVKSWCNLLFTAFFYYFPKFRSPAE